MQLLEHFKELSIYPKNAKELKGLILQLAVQGKLTRAFRDRHPELVSGSHSAKALLTSIKAEKEQLIKDKKIKKEKPLPAITADEIPFDLPEEWEWCRLRDIGVTQTGNTPSKSKAENFGDFIPFLGPANILNDWIEYPAVGLSELGLQKGRLILKDSLLMVCIGGSIGKCNINDIDISCNQQINTITSIIAPVQYVKIIGQSKYFQKNVILKSSGSATPIINKGKWESIVIPVPPLTEQKAIVETVNTLFKEVEALEKLTVERVKLKEDFITSALRELSTGDTPKEWAYLQKHFSAFMNEQSNIKKLRETILQLAVQGKLTANWRARHPELVSGSHSAKAVLKQIQKEKTQLIADKKIKKEKPLPAITADEIPYELPEGWEWCRLANLTRIITKGSSPKWQGVEYVEEENGILFITSENVGNYKLLLEKKKFVEPKFNEIEPRSLLKRDDILMNIVGGSIGRTAIYNLDEVANINQAVTIIRLIPKVNYQYFLHFFNSPVCISYMYDKQVDNARPNLSMGNISKFKIPFPSLTEQGVIVEKVNSLMALCDELEKAVIASKANAEQLMQSLIRELFEKPIHTEALAAATTVEA
ncbi:restriction endonuclease subunit S [Ancylomarina longa]|uniref:Type I restriction modification DNA specificity domain-containing protein n=1 Tax=Ancylomarina longa TaxID=2487017 RepID=A0A434AWB8_9BACT|nr:restriction endonuclease subunit S [Ancylomarina longa]RUT78782.1 hypothetical protein DLK05_06500 [Ancylomarina longa]